MDDNVLQFIKENNYILSKITITVISCNENLPSNIPQKCANQKDIDEFMNNIDIQLKLEVKQFNLQSQSMESTFQTLVNFSKKGLFIYDKSIYNAPGYYLVDNQSINRQFVIQNQGSCPYNFITIKPDQITQQTSIQFPTIPQILALVNSFVNICMFFRIFFRYLSQLDLKKDFFMVILKNIYQDTYQNMLKINKLCQPIEKLNQEYNFKGLQDKTLTLQQENQNIKKENQETEEACKDESIFFEEIDLKYKIQNKNQYNHYENQQIPQNQQESHCIGPKLYCTINLQNNQLFINTLNISGQNHKQKNIYIKMQPEQQHIQQQNQIEQNDFVQLEQIKKINQQQKTQIQNLKLSQDKTLTSKLIKIIFSFMTFNKKKQLNSKGLQIQHKKKMIKQIDQDLNVSQFHQDLIFLKKAIMILLTQDQLATLQLIGCSQNFLNLRIDQLDAQSSMLEPSIKNLNHYEIQLEITQYLNFQDKYIQQFLNRCSSSDKNKSISEIDKRILDSINSNESQV
ncbi:hypothetical protein ABPG72_001608 [Tetrahymena utriculariae]